MKARWTFGLQFVVVLVVTLVAGDGSPAAAQGWNPDARTAGLGGMGGAENLFVSTVNEDRGDRSIVIPLGLVQLLLDREVLNPRSSAFDPARALEYGANPMHFIFGRSRSNRASEFVTGVRNGSLQPDLNAYRGFVPTAFTAGALATPRWGYTFSLHERDGERLHGLYVGGGPHLAVQTRLEVDAGLQALLASDIDAYAANKRFMLQNQSTGQAAAAVTAGYRGKWVLGSARSATPAAAFVAVNANYLHGIRYEDIDVRLRLETGGDGLLVEGAAAAPLMLTRITSSRGRGLSLDVGGGINAGPWQLGISANGLGNRIIWRGVESRDYWLDSLSSGFGRFERSTPVAMADLSAKAPVAYRANIGFRTERWSALAEVDRDWRRTSFRGGFEHHTRHTALRAAAARVDETWLPSAGLSVPISPRVWVDLAAFSTMANLERTSRTAVALSLRIKPRTP